MGYRLVEVELSQPLQDIQLTEAESGVGLVTRFGDTLVGYLMEPRPAGALITADELRRMTDARFAASVLALRAEAELTARFPAAPAPRSVSLTVAICTKDRAERLKRLLGSLLAVRASAPFSSVEILVVDNAPSDERTRAVVSDATNVRYLCEPKAGLNFARNAALQNATEDLIAYLDDDVVVDRHWLGGLHRAWRGNPEAGGFTGLVLPYRLETEAQVCFEAGGGFGRGFQRTSFGAARFGNWLHPVGAGLLGAGCNMAFDRRLLVSLGGFDNALDTGAPLPGGGDLDIFYRVLRSGRAMVYEPTYAVYHEHRETLPQLKRQYWTWGLGFMAFLTKCRRSDPALNQKHSAMALWWVLDRGGAIARAGLRRRWRELGFAWAELIGGVQGAAGEYDRSRDRVGRIERLAA